MTDEIAKAAAQMGDMNEGIRKVEQAALLQKPTMVAAGVARRDLSPSQLALEIAVEALKFISNLTVRNELVNPPAESIEPFSRLEAKIALAKIGQALGQPAKTDSEATQG